MECFRVVLNNTVVRDLAEKESSQLVVRAVVKIPLNITVKANRKEAVYYTVKNKFLFKTVISSIKIFLNK